MDDNWRWRAIRVRAIRVELRSTEVDPNGSNDLSNLLFGSNVRSVPFDDDSSGDGLRPAIHSVSIDEPKLLSVRIPDELQSAPMVPTPCVRIVRHRNASQTLGGTQYLGATQSEHPVSLCTHRNLNRRRPSLICVCVGRLVRTHTHFQTTNDGF
jgi:hypothetical protein